MVWLDCVALVIKLKPTLLADIQQFCQLSLLLEIISFLMVRLTAYRRISPILWITSFLRNSKSVLGLNLINV